MQGFSTFPFDPNTKNKHVQTGGVCTRGPLIKTTAPTTSAVGFDGKVWAFPVTGTINLCYNQVSLGVVTAVGNVRIAVYDSVAGEPTNLLSETADETLIVNTVFYSLPEFTARVDKLWLCLQVSSSTADLSAATEANGARNLVHAYGTYPDPFGTPVVTTTVADMGLSHTV